MFHNSNLSLDARGFHRAFRTRPYGKDEAFEGSVVKGKVVAIEKTWPSSTSA